MKKIVLLSSICAMGAVFAADPIEGLNDSSNVIGALANPTDGKPQKILVAVPFLGYGSGEASDVSVSNLMATANLPDNTYLRVVTEVDGRTIKSWRSWRLESGEWIKIDPVEVKNESDVTVVTQAEGVEADVATVGRGTSFWLEFDQVEDRTTVPSSFYTLGQVDSSLAKSIELVSGKWNLVGNPGVDKFNVLDHLKDLTNPEQSATYAKNDRICVQLESGLQLSYIYNGKCWTSMNKVVPSVDIDPGQGCWIKLANDATFKF